MMVKDIYGGSSENFGDLEKMQNKLRKIWTKLFKKLGEGEIFGKYKRILKEIFFFSFENFY